MPIPICHSNRLFSSVFVLSTSFALMVGPSAQAQTPTTGTSYTNEQADAGAPAYEQYCSSCHGRTLAGGTGGPALSGEAFATRWAGRDLGSLINLISTSMPPGGGSALLPGDFLNITAHILRTNGIRASQNPLMEGASATLASLPRATAAPAARAAAPAPRRSKSMPWAG